MNDAYTGDTWLYLVRIWRSRGEDASVLRGKVQHVVTGAACYFDGLSNLAGALETLIAQEGQPFASDLARHEDHEVPNTMQKENQDMEETTFRGEMPAQAPTQTRNHEEDGRTKGAGSQQPEGLFTGELIRPGDPDYETSRMSWNTRFDRRPGLIVKCRSTDDVRRAVIGAKQNNLSIAVRSGGHSPAGFSTTDGGVLIDLSLMDELTIDRDRRVATVGPGLTWGAYSVEANRYGLTTPAGDNATVGVGGLTLGGGIGWLARKYGMTIDHLLSAEVVTADGEVLTASDTDHPDLFWALRGGGGNFGIVTRFEFDMVPVGDVVAGVLVLPAEPDVLVAFARAAAEAPDELTTISEVMKIPPLPFLPHDLYGKVHLLAAFCYAGDQTMAAAERVLEPLRAAGQVLGQMVAPMPYPGVFKFTEEGSIRGPYSVRSHFLRTLDLQAAEVIVAAARRGTSPASMVQVRVLGGALSRVPAEATAFAHRNETIFVAAINPWIEAAPEEMERHTAWTESLSSALKPRATGAYASFHGDEREESINQAYPPNTYRRLAQIKARYDPTNLFRANCNIVPAP